MDYTSELTSIRLNQLLWIQDHLKDAEKESSVTRDVMGYMGFAVLVALLLIVWVVMFHEGIVLPIEPPKAQAVTTL